MNQQDLNYLSDFFSEIALAKTKSLSEFELTRVFENINNYDKAFQAKMNYKRSSEISIELSNILIDNLESDLLLQQNLIATDWDNCALHMKCIHAQFIPASSPTNWFLTYSINVDQLYMVFQCQVGEDGVFNYHLEQHDEIVKDPHDYYFSNVKRVNFNFTST